jgi:hypothetical protein
MSAETFNLLKCAVVYKNDDPEFKGTTIPPNSEIILWGKLHYGFYGMQGLCVSSRYIILHKFANILRV